ncbi:hypothetical protein [Streptomyces sp. NPDC058583]|uniref:hypothetical protein n=1 Tax=unclassified Streptomyces TaxID=2593676 RepID=UPI0036501557
MGNLEACLENKDSENCWELGADVLVGSKLKVLDKTLDSLQLLRRGCKLVGAATRMAPSGAKVTTVQTTASGTKGCLDLKKDYIVKDPESGDIITDIDFIEGHTLWEDKHVLGYWGWTDSDWIEEHVQEKFEKYLKARAQLPEFYRDASIGFRFTRPNRDSRFIAAVEARFQKLREQYPDIRIQTRWF